MRNKSPTKKKGYALEIQSIISLILMMINAYVFSEYVVSRPCPVWFGITGGIITAASVVIFGFFLKKIIIKYLNL